ncbi:hypothetical protein NP590_18340, partial [Methylomonas sp. SURF-2]
PIRARQPRPSPAEKPRLSRKTHSILYAVVNAALWYKNAQEFKFFALPPSGESADSRPASLFSNCMFFVRADCRNRQVTHHSIINQGA